VVDPDLRRLGVPGAATCAWCGGVCGAPLAGSGDGGATIPPMSSWSARDDAPAFP